MTEALLLHDLQDAWRLQDNSLGCVPDGLLDSLPATGAGLFSELGGAACFAAASMPACCDHHSDHSTAPRPVAQDRISSLRCHPLAGCGSIPEGLDPRSFRATYGFNTNLYAFAGERESARSPSLSRALSLSLSLAVSGRMLALPWHMLLGAAGLGPATCP